MELSTRNVGRLFRMELPELMYRGRQETFKFVDRLRVSHPLGAQMDARKNAWQRFIDQSRSQFFEGPFDAQLPERLERTHPEECQELLIAAHHAVRGRFDLLGYRGLEFGDPVDWHLDAVSGRRAPKIHWSRLDPLDCAAIGDSKVIWELNRHQWMVGLGQAWRMTRDGRYADSVVRYVQEWIRDNPVGVGINWASSLEVAFRLISWSWALMLIRDARAATPEFFALVERSVEAHANHVERYLSYYFSPNTHLTGEALGLFYAGVVFRHLKRSDRWRSLASRILIEEIGRQVLFDGIYFERSTCYQRYTADIYLHFLIVAQRANMPVPPIVTKRLRSLLDALVALRNPDGSMPSIGDADGGMVLPLSTASPDDYSATFATAAVFFRDPTYAWAAGRAALDTMWMFGSEAAAAFDALEQRPPDCGTVQVFSSGGLVSMRSSWDADAHGMIFDAGPLGCHYSAGHGHADLLSIQCSAFGERYLVDAGTCCYTADSTVRDFFRSTAAHNTVMIDGLSQSEPAGPFSWTSLCSAQLLGWTIDDRVISVDGFHDAYRARTGSVTQRRRVVFVESKFWVVIDDLCGRDTHRVDLRFQFAPMHVTNEDGWVRATRNGRRGLLLRAFPAASLNLSIREGQRDPMEGWTSAHYGAMEPAPAAVYSGTARFPIRVLTLLWPAEDVRVTPEIEILRNDKGHLSGICFDAVAVEFDDDEIYVRHRGNH